MKSIILSLCMLFMMVIAVPAEDATQGTQVPDKVIMDIMFFRVNSSSVLIWLVFTPTEEALKNPPEFELQFGDDAGDYHYKVPMTFDNAIDEDGEIKTRARALTSLKPGKTYHYNIHMKFLGADYNTGDQIFNTEEGI